MTPATDRTPVSIVTGCLGAGKTTLLNHVLRAPELADAAVIINEFGDIALDHLLVTAPGENVVTLANGCICCEMRGDLVETLAALYVRRRDGSVPAFGKVLIETTGLADPVPILQSLLTDRELAPLFRLDSIVTLVDAVHGAAQLDAGAEAVKQAALADRLLISKTDLAPAVARAGLEARLAQLNPGAEILPVVRGAIDPARLFGAGLGEMERSAGIASWLHSERYAGGAAAHDGHAGHAHARADVSAFCLYHEKPVSQAGLVLWLHLLASLRGAKLLRMKGLLNVEGRPVAVHAVQTLIEEPVALTQWPDAERRSRLVFITRGLERAEIEKTLSALEFEAAPAPGGAIDAAEYARFVAAASGFR